MNDTSTFEYFSTKFVDALRKPLPVADLQRVYKQLQLILDATMIYAIFNLNPVNTDV